MTKRIRDRELNKHRWNSQPTDCPVCQLTFESVRQMLSHAKFVHGMSRERVEEMQGKKK